MSWADEGKYIVFRVNADGARIRFFKHDRYGPNHWDLGSLTDNKRLFGQSLGIRGLEEFHKDLGEFIQSLGEHLKVDGFSWDIQILPDKKITIGCHTATPEEWASYDDRKIIELAGSSDRRKALDFWHANRDDILAKAGWKEERGMGFRINRSEKKDAWAGITSIELNGESSHSTAGITEITIDEEGDMDFPGYVNVSDVRRFAESLLAAVKEVEDGSTK